MNTVGNFLKLRKRYNSIKIAFILSLCTLYFIINGTADVISFGLYINAPTEYLLKSNESGALLDIKAEWLLDECEATAVSRQLSYLIENKEGGIITVSALTPEYLFRAYGIAAKEGDKMTYIKRFPYTAIADLTLWRLEADFMKLTDNTLGFGKKLIWQRQE